MALNKPVITACSSWAGSFLQLFRGVFTHTHRRGIQLELARIWLSALSTFPVFALWLSAAYSTLLLLYKSLKLQIILRTFAALFWSECTLTLVVVANMYLSRNWKLSTFSRITWRFCSKKSVLLRMMESPWGSWRCTNTVVGLSCGSTPLGD